MVGFWGMTSYLPGLDWVQTSGCWALVSLSGSLVEQLIVLAASTRETMALFLSS